MDAIVLYLTAALSLASLAICIALFARSGKSHASRRDAEQLQRALSDELRESRTELSRIGMSVTQNQQAFAEMQDRRLSELTASVNEALVNADRRSAAYAAATEQKLENIRASVEARLAAIQADNTVQLDKMRATVDEKLQKTLEERIGKSFQAVSSQLEQVYKGLGEMQTLAAGVGDLKRVLTNVKTRGILGEVQLGAILEQIMSPEQYDTNVAVVPGSSNVVEFAIKLPGNGSERVYLPIDSKFPGDTYHHLLDAIDGGNIDEIRLAEAALATRIKLSARDICEKYIDPPYTTDFAIMFLPFEGLYAEVLRLGLLEELQRDYHINIAGPTTTAALLNSLQMGFKTLAIQKRSSEVWKLLGAVRTEFEKFETVLTAAQSRLNQANNELDKLVGTRTRQIIRRLKNVTALPEDESAAALSDGAPTDEDFID